MVKAQRDIYMAKAVAVRDYGDQYQALVFWKYALDLLKKDSDIKNIGYEYDELNPLTIL